MQPFPREAEALLDPFRSPDAPTNADYEGLFRYFVEGFVAYRRPDGAHAEYPGLRSWNGRESDGREGFARIAPLLAAWIQSGRGTSLHGHDGTTIDLALALRQGLLAGTDPRSPASWGPIRHYDQKIVDAADVALAIWLVRDTLWMEFSSDQRRRVTDWLGRSLTVRVWDNGWHLLAAFGGAVARALGAPVDEARIVGHYRRMKDFHVGRGWFTDGLRGPVDYYNAWHVQYLLYWLQRVDPGWDTAFIDDARSGFLEAYRHLVGPSGLALLGRSIPYRLAVPTPLTLGHVADPRDVTAGEARRALDAVWKYFIQRDAVTEGRITQGYLGDDPRLVDNYLGPASPLWSLRSLIAAFSMPPHAEFWRTAPGRLPVEERDYEITVAEIGWTIRGWQDTGVIEIEILGGRGGPPHRLSGHDSLRRSLESLLPVPLRPGNRRAKYSGRIYRSDYPLGS